MPAFCTMLWQGATPWPILAIHIPYLEVLAYTESAVAFKPNRTTVQAVHELAALLLRHRLSPVMSCPATARVSEGGSLCWSRAVSVGQGRKLSIEQATTRSHGPQSLCEIVSLLSAHESLLWDTLRQDQAYTAAMRMGLSPACRTNCFCCCFLDLKLHLLHCVCSQLYESVSVYLDSMDSMNLAFQLVGIGQFRGSTGRSKVGWNILGLHHSAMALRMPASGFGGAAFVLAGEWISLHSFAQSIAVQKWRMDTRPGT